MNRHRHTLGLAGIALLAVAPAFAFDAERAVGRPAGPAPAFGRTPSVIFYDDMDGGENGWTHVDNTGGAEEYFHLAANDPYAGAYSWCCGADDPSLSGGSGYGNDWDQLLTLPEIDVSGAVQPVLEFAYRTDTESEYDFACVEAESSGVFVRLSPKLWGGQGWQSMPAIPIAPTVCDDPLRARFRFVSDSAWSDEDGGHDSDGGGFYADNIRVYDYYDGTTLFYDDGESGGLCTPAVPQASGDWWHRVERSCASYSEPSCWWCGDDGDTSLLPPGLDNSLTSPPIDISGSLICTLRFLVHAQIPTDDDFWTEEVSTDGGVTWYMTGAWWGDFGECDSWGGHGIDGVDLTPYLPGDVLMFRISMHTSDNGCGPGSLGGAGIALDDTWVEDWTGSTGATGFLLGGEESPLSPCSRYPLPRKFQSIGRGSK